MNISELNRVIAEALGEVDVKPIVAAIEAEMERQGFQNMGVEVDTGAFEPDVTIFTSWFDEFSSKQAEKIRDEFNLFKTTENLDGGEVYTEEDVPTLVDVDGEEKSEGSIRFVAVISADANVAEIAENIASAYVQQMTNFWDEIYSEEMLADRELGEDFKANNVRVSKPITEEEEESFYVTYKIKGNKTFEVKAKDENEALTKAEDLFANADLGDMEIDDAEPIYTEDAQGNRVWEE